MTSAVARGKIDRGVKRRCAACATLFYDLLHYPIQCPKCGTPYVSARPGSSPSSAKRFKAASPRARSRAAAVPLVEADNRKQPGDKTEDAEVDAELDQ